MNRRASEPFEPQLRDAKRGNTLELLFRSARRVNEWALARANERRAAEAASGQYGQLRPSHTALLPHIDLAGTRLTTLATRLGVSKQAVGQVVAELEDLGVVERRPDPDDGRAKLVTFSARGRQGLLDGLALLREIEAELGLHIGASRMQEFQAILSDLLDYVEVRDHELASRLRAGAPPKDEPLAP